MPRLCQRIFLRSVSRLSFVALLLALALSLSSNVRANVAAARLTQLSVTQLDDGGSEVVLQANRRLTYSARIAQAGLRLSIDLRGAVNAGAATSWTDAKGVVASVMLQTFRNGVAPTTRVLIQLNRQASFRVVPGDGGLRVVLRPAKKTAAVSALAVRQARAAKSVAKARPAGAQLRDVRFEHHPRRDGVVLAVEGNPRRRVVRHGPSRTVLVLHATDLPVAIRRQLDVSAFGGLVHMVSTYRRAGDVWIDVDHDRGAVGRVLSDGGGIRFVFSRGLPAPLSRAGAPDGRATRRVKTVAAENPILTGGVESALETTVRQWTSEADQASGFMAVPAQVRRYTGKRIDLDLKDADVHNVLRILADVGKINIVTADNVKGKVTIRMKNVPWDQALDTVLQAKQLGMVRRGNIVRVALTADLAKERELQIARRRSELALAPLETRLIPVSYANAAQLQPRAKELLSPRGSIAVDQRTNVLVCRDVTGNLNQVEELVRALDTQTPQVLIEARIVEATSRFKRDVGIQWGGDVAFGPATGNETGLSFPSSLGLVGGASDQETPTAGLSPINSTIDTPNFAVNLPAAVGVGSGGALGLSLGSIDNTINLAIRLSALEATGMLRIVSSPRVLTLDNTQARISQGTLIPFSQISAQGVQTVFQEAKLQLLVTPHVTADGSVSMKVKINRDEPDFNQTSSRGDPTILKREAETELLVRDGHTAVIGGIYTRNTGRNIDQLPLLGNIPILGLMFQRRRSSDARSELVIFLTPRIVNRAEALGQ